MNQVCPHCGTCPTCGHSAQAQAHAYYATPYWYYPTTWTGGYVQTTSFPWQQYQGGQCTISGGTLNQSIDPNPNQ